MSTPAEMQTQAWAIRRMSTFDLSQFSRKSGFWSMAGTLELVAGKLRYLNAKGEVVFETPAKEAKLEFPPMYFGHGFNVVVGEAKYFVQFAWSPSDVGQFIALWKGRRITKAWRQALE